jgi:hypothetical protein
MICECVRNSRSFVPDSCRLSIVQQALRCSHRSELARSLPVRPPNAARPISPTVVTLR